MLSLTLLALPLLAVATPLTTRWGGEPASSCTTGPVQCCDTVTTANNAAAAKVLGLLEIVVQDLNVLVGLTCSPISVIGVGSNSCKANPVCCSDNSHGSAVSIGCVPVSL
ncbi:hypothetical protein QCA50_014896 [Cerrena zonata]|uniref:Hydrophobin n=1 Tax=Cerrena zonata TaxID=2478898 RepID=A0AAW0FSA6_9APHY